MTIRRLQSRKLHLDGRIHPDFQAVETTLRDQLRKYPGGAAVSVSSAISLSFNNPEISRF